MIEKIHRYSGLMMAVLVISAVAFIFGDFNRGAMKGGGGHPYLKIAGRTYTDKEYRNLGESSRELVMALAQSGEMSLFQFVIALSGMPTSGGENDAAEKFFISRMILRNAKEQFGVHPGDDEISAYIRQMRAFAGADGKFDATAYGNFIQRYMGRLGMTERDLRELASDVLATQKINAIVGAGLTADRNATAAALALKDQKISGEVAKLDLAPFEEKIQPTEDEIKKYWEIISDSFTTEPRRKFTYILVGAKPITEAKVEDAPESIADAAASDEAKKAAAKKKEEEQSERAATAAEERRKNQLAIDSEVDDFVSTLIDQKGTGFEELAKKNGWEVKTTEFFPQSEPPKELDLTLRFSSAATKAVDELFKIQETSDPFSKISNATPVGENQWLIARLDGEEKSRPKEYAEARDEARAQYISEKSIENLKTAAADAAAKIKTLLASGKTFQEAATEAGLTEIKEFTDITSAYRPDGATEPSTLFAAASNVDPGALADVITESDRAFVLHVTKREVVKTADVDTRIDSEVTSGTSSNELIAFVSWISAQTADAKVEPLYNR